MSKKFKKPQPTKVPPVKRRCLKCDKTFLSYGIGNRVCAECKGRIEWTESRGEFQVGFPTNAYVKSHGY